MSLGFFYLVFLAVFVITGDVALGVPGEVSLGVPVGSMFTVFCPIFLALILNFNQLYTIALTKFFSLDQNIDLDLDLDLEIVLSLL